MHPRARRGSVQTETVSYRIRKIVHRKVLYLTYPTPYRLGKW
jgi:hypothetical protein